MSNKFHYLLISLMFAAFVFSCGGGEKALDYTVTSTGDSITSASLTKDGSNYKVTLAPIVNPNSNSPYGSSDASKISAAAVSNPAPKIAAKLEPLYAVDACTATVEFGKGEASKADIAFLIDNTGSMDNVIESVINSIDSFAQSLADEKLDVRFAAATIGDAYNTKKEEASNYTIGTGADEPPTFDTIERPMIDFTDINDFKAFTAEVLADYDIMFGGGNGSEENYYGAVMAMANLRDGQQGFTPRAGVPYYQVLIGDNCGHTAEKMTDAITDKWVPDPKADVSSLSGKVTVHVVRNASTDTCWDTDLISLAEIADATGGAKLDLGSGTFDLNDLNLDDFITNFWFVFINSSCVEGKSFVLVMTLSVDDDGDGTPDRTQVFTFTVTG